MHIALQIVGQGAPVNFFVNPRAKMGRVMEAYCERQNLDCNLVEFRFNGEKIFPTQTALDLGVLGQGIIYALLIVD